jgi:hypothetical protein
MCICNPPTVRYEYKIMVLVIFSFRQLLSHNRVATSLGIFEFVILIHPIEWHSFSLSVSDPVYFRFL